MSGTPTLESRYSTPNQKPYYWDIQSDLLNKAVIHSQEFYLSQQYHTNSKPLPVPDFSISSLCSDVDISKTPTSLELEMLEKKNSQMSAQDHRPLWGCPLETTPKTTPKDNSQASASIDNTYQHWMSQTTVADSPTHIESIMNNLRQRLIGCPGKHSLGLYPSSGYCKSCNSIVENVETYNCFLCEFIICKECYIEPAP